MRSLNSLAIVLVPLCIACNTVLPRPDVPALIVAPTPQSHAALVEAVRAALDDAPVTLPNDALTKTSTLLVERPGLQESAAHVANKCEPSTPERFHLVQDGSECILIHEASGKQFELAGTACCPAPGK
jgi:hypothetical protein